MRTNRLFSSLFASTLAATLSLVPLSAHAEGVASTQPEGAYAAAIPQGLSDLEKASPDDLEKFYQGGTNDVPVPEGRAQGQAFFLGLPGLSQVQKALADAGVPVPPSFVENLVANTVWRGKTFTAVEGDPQRVGVLTNQILGLDLASADIRRIEESTTPEEAQTFFLDYSASDLPLARGIQDYIRRIGPDLYLGKAYLTIPGTAQRVLLCYFALDFSAAAKAR